MSIENEFNKPVKGLKFKLPEEVYDYKTKRYINSKKIYGKVDKNRMFAVTSKKTGKIEHINDFANLPKSYKNHILQYFDDSENKDKRTLYLVKSDYDKEPVKKSKTKTKNSNNPKSPKNPKKPSATNTKANKDKCCNDLRFIAPIQGKKVKMAMNNFYTYVNSKKKKRMNKHEAIQL